MARDDRAVAKASVLMALNAKNFKKDLKETENKWQRFCLNIRAMNKKYFGGNEAITNFTRKLSLLGPVASDVAQACAISATRLASAFTAVAGAALNVAGVVGGALVAGLGAGAGYAIKAAADYEKLQKQFEATGGSLKDLEAVKQMARNTPGINTSDAVSATSAFMRMGKSVKDSVEAVRILANAASSSGQGGDAVQRAVVQMEQLAGKTSGFAGDLLSISNTFPDVKKRLNEAFGTQTIEEIAELGFTGQQVVDAIIASYSQLPTMTLTFSDRLENLKSDLNDIAILIGQNLMPYAEKLLSYTSAVVAYILNNKENFILMLNDIFNLANKKMNEFFSSAKTVIGWVMMACDYIVTVISNIKSAWDRTVESFKHPFSKDSLIPHKSNEGSWGDFWSRTQNGDYLGNLGKQFNNELYPILGKYGFAPSQIRAGVDAELAKNIANDVHKLANNTNVQASAFGGNR